MRLSEHFTTEEFKCRCGCGKSWVERPLLDKLEAMRAILGCPVIINSGVRCPEHNKAEGGKPTSAHLSGEAADIRVENGEDRYNVLYAAFAAGFKRIGVANGFIHVDVAGNLPTPNVWKY